MSTARKLLPKRLEEDLDGASKFKPTLPQPKSRTVAELLGESAERAMFNEILGPYVCKPRISEAKSTDYCNKDNDNNKGFDNALIGRVSSLEEESRRLRSQLTTSSHALEAALKENRYLKSQLDEKDANFDEYNRVLEENEDLKSKISEMEAFLQDYGLVWIGYQQTPEISSMNVKEDDLDHLVSFDEFSKKVNELNEMLDMEPSRFIAQDNKARLTRPQEYLDKISIYYYKNGLLVNRGPLRLIGTPEYLRFVRDIVDGYFPSEFREKHPQGIYLQVYDKHKQDYKEVDNLMSKEDLMNKLPSTVIRNGNVYPIKNDLAALLSSSNKNNEDQSLEKALKSSCSIREKESQDRDIPKDHQCSIVVKFLHGVQKQLIMSRFDNVSDLENTITSSLGNREPSLELRTSFPPKLLDDPNATLEDVGLFPNGVIHCRIKTMV